MVFFFKDKTAYEMRISDWSSDVCSSDLVAESRHRRRNLAVPRRTEGLEHAAGTRNMGRGACRAVLLLDCACCRRPGQVRLLGPVTVVVAGTLRIEFRR